ncbi:hypothetical protein Misp01_32860 [Microtetraspora sp. NBRC 13810]|uniref:LysM peptidoglycan-binding domain-containing protein n=1 Tax=Microtetraspora sp. NBRC 13810 TaxID=3030990 RepID=UPI0024A1C952|nr:LysM peptidoglycan-binding domain-containing protein [Microtetraspora sp. NBRC 13810]GLW08156.1 hypothetical protein Misp01_32860 [Microtetraspora sp. NBRC 13810]
MVDSLSDLVTTLINAIKALGSDRDERQLNKMAAACTKLAADLGAVGKQIDPVILAGHGTWTGAAATRYQQMATTYFSQSERADVVKNLGHVTEVLGMAKQASHETKRALVELLKSIGEAIAASAVISVAFGAMGKYAAWAAREQMAAKAGTYAVSIMTRLVWNLQKLAKPIQLIARFLGKGRTSTTLASRPALALKRNNLRDLLVNMGNGRLVKGMTLAGSEGMSFGATSLAAMKNFWKVFGMSYTGNYVTTGLGRMMNGQSFITPFGLGYAQMNKASWVAGALPFSSTVWTGLAARHPVRMNFMAGFTAGSIPSIMNDRLEGKPWSEVAQNYAKFGLVSGVFNASMGGLFGKVGIRDPKMVMGLGSFFGLIPGTALRGLPEPIGTPLAPVPEPLRINEDARTLRNAGSIPDDALAPKRAEPPAQPAPTQPAPVQRRAGENSLWDIAEQVYGDGTRWRDIYEANRQLIGPDPTKIQPDMTFTIPRK